mmetsp:Transcript_4839/g.13922  ORF Transcript_4839/g.13922 Transcript_4839/m.13922 type:complete len:108 (-) Transcript_4839:321-644(-)
MCAVSSASMPAPQHKGASQQGGLPPRVGLADVSRCHRLLEQCLVRELNQRQAMALLQRYAGISPVFSGCVWRQLELENPSFFKAYNDRLAAKANSSAHLKVSAASAA